MKKLIMDDPDQADPEAGLDPTFHVTLRSKHQLMAAGMVHVHVTNRAPPGSDNPRSMVTKTKHQSAFVRSRYDPCNKI
jgi:hypothetical protein